MVNSGRTSQVPAGQPACLASKAPLARHTVAAIIIATPPGALPGAAGRVQLAGNFADGRLSLIAF